MYNERKESFSFRNFFLTLLLLILFILLMLFLFPTRWELKKKCNTAKVVNNTQEQVIVDEVFKSNLNRMSDVAKGYFTEDKLPKNNNETKKITLREMYDKHLIVKTKDSDGKECDQDKSYAEITRENSEYKLKVNLSCGETENYIVNTIKSNTKTNGTTNVVDNNTNNNTTNNNTNNNTNVNTNNNIVVADVKPSKIAVSGISVSQQNVTLKVGETLKITTTINPSNATNTNTIWKSNNTNIATISNKTIKGISAGSTVVTVATIDGNKTATIKVTVVNPQEIKEEQPVKPQTPTYTCKIVNGKYYDSTGKVVDQNTYNKSCNIKVINYEYKLVTTAESAWSNWQRNEIKPSANLKVETRTVKETYTYNETVKTPYNKQIQVGTEDIIEERKIQVAVVDKTENGVTTKVPAYKIIKVKVGEKPIYKTITEYKNETVKKTGTRNVTEYRSKTITQTTDVKWSTNNNDTSLLNKGYKLTGVTK